jgi:hypothetical protein
MNDSSDPVADAAQFLVIAFGCGVVAWLIPGLIGPEGLMFCVVFAAIGVGLVVAAAWQFFGARRVKRADCRRGFEVLPADKRASDR